jgi:ammonia channel protein AmtB
MDATIAAADTAWVLAATAAVAFTAPGPALLYGGMDPEEAGAAGASVRDWTR